MASNSTVFIEVEKQMRNAFVIRENHEMVKYIRAASDKTQFVVVENRTKNSFIIREQDELAKYKKVDGWKPKEKPKYIAQAAALPKCTLNVPRMTNDEMQKIIDDGERKEKVGKLVEKIRNLPGECVAHFLEDYFIVIFKNLGFLMFIFPIILFHLYSVLKVHKAVEIIKKNEPQMVFNDTEDIDFFSLCDETLRVLKSLVNGTFVNATTTPTVPSTSLNNQSVDMNMNRTGIDSENAMVTGPNTSTNNQSVDTNSTDLNFEGIDWSLDFAWLHDANFEYGGDIEPNYLSDIFGELQIDNEEGAIGGSIENNNDGSVNDDKKPKDIFDNEHDDRGKTDWSKEYNYLFGAEPANESNDGTDWNKEYDDLFGASTSGTVDVSRKDEVRRKLNFD